MENATEEEKKEYEMKIRLYCQEMLRSFLKCNMEGEQLWVEFCSSFRRHTLEYLDKDQSLLLVELLTEKGIFINRRRGLSRIRALIKCSEQEEFIPHNRDNTNQCNTA